MNRVESFSQEELLLQTLIDLILGTGTQEAVSYNAMLAEYLGELVKERLVKLAEAEMAWTTRGWLLEQAYGRRGGGASVTRTFGNPRTPV